MNNHTLLAAIGNTPLVRIDGIYAKLEFANPSGSVKDRAALGIIEDAEKSGALKPGYTIVEASSGNMGISLAMVASIKGYKMIVVMPEHMSDERKQMIQALGAELVLTPRKGSFRQAIRTAAELARRPMTYYADQYANPSNTRAQQKIGEEILREIGAVDAVVAGIGTGGTLMGMAGALKKANPALHVVAVEPAESPVMSMGEKAVIREHKIQGIGPGFIPALVDMKQIDEVITVSSDEAMAAARKICKDCGILAGISAGANICAARKVAKRFAKVATVLPDRAERYLSMGLLKC
jgi:cysteine synthase A